MHLSIHSFFVRETVPVCVSCVNFLLLAFVYKRKKKDSITDEKPLREKKGWKLPPDIVPEREKMRKTKKR